MAQFKQDDPASPSEGERWEIADRASVAQAQGRHGLSEFAEREHLPLSTARRWARVARAFPPKERRVLGITFSHFEAVAGHADRVRLIAVAARERWSASRLKAEAMFATAAEQPKAAAERSFGPATLDAAHRYLGWLSRDGSSTGRRPDPAVREGVGRLQRASTKLVASWADRS